MVGIWNLLIVGKGLLNNLITVWCFFLFSEGSICHMKFISLSCTYIVNI